MKLTAAGRAAVGMLLSTLLVGGWLALRHTAPQTANGTPQRVRVIVPQSGSRTPAIAPHHHQGDREVGLSSPCPATNRQRLIIVSIRHQHLWACSSHHTFLSTPVTTGMDHPGSQTPRGSFAVQGIERHVTLTTDGPKSYRVKYWIPFHLGVWGFHDASWQTIPFGSSRYVSHGSHGCVHMPLPAIRSLFHWVKYDTVVRIR